MDRSEKEALVADLHRTFEGTTLLVITHQTGLTVAEVSDLRRRMRQAGATYKVTKNRLTKRALGLAGRSGLRRVEPGVRRVASGRLG